MLETAIFIISVLDILSVEDASGIDEKSIPAELPEYYGIGDENEALMFLKESASLISRNTEVLDWMMLIDEE